MRLGWYRAAAAAAVAAADGSRVYRFRYTHNFISNSLNV